MVEPEAVGPLLGQQALVGPEPREVRPQPVGANTGSPEPRFHWGIDPSTQRVAIAWNGPELGVAVKPFRRSRHAERLDNIYEVTYAFAQQLAGMFPPLVVWVEQASGARPNLPLMYSVGVVQAAVFGALKDMWAFPVWVETVPSGTWKKVATGRGNAKPPEYLAWARLNGYQGLDLDEAAAWGVAMACRRSVAFEKAA